MVPVQFICTFSVFWNCNINIYDVKINILIINETSGTIVPIINSFMVCLFSKSDDIKTNIYENINMNEKKYNLK